MARSVDKIFVFSVAAIDFGRIVASVGENEKKTEGENIFELLGMKREAVSEVCSIISGYGKPPYATVCGEVRRHAVMFFKNFAFCTSLCLVVIPAISARVVADLMVGGMFEGFVVSEALSSLASEGFESAFFTNREEYLHLSRMFGQIMDLMALKLQYTAQPPDDFRIAGEGVAELLGISMNFDTYIESDNDALVSVDEIFDGRFCAAAILIFALLAAKRSTDRSFDLTVVRGMGGLQVDMAFNCRRPVRLEALDHLKNIAYFNHGIEFDIQKSGGQVLVSFIPLYPDVGFVGVKNGEEIFDLVEYRELF